MNPPLVSIITPSFNQAAYLEQTLQSVLRQNYPNLEYFVIDGGSSDSSLEILQRYTSRLSAWVSEPDSGQAEAINKGFARAQGEIIAWLNSDDLYLPGAISQAVSALQQTPQAALVYGNLLSIDAASQPFNLQTFAPWQLPDLMRFHILGQPSVFLRRSALQKTGGLDPSYHLLLDHQLWLKILRQGQALYLPKTLAAARYHPQAKNLARAAEFGREAFRLVEWMRTEPGLAPLYLAQRRKILAGAQRLNAFYLLESGHYPQSLAAYARAFLLDPGLVLREAHRPAYALLAPLGLAGLRQLYNRWRQKRLF